MKKDLGAVWIGPVLALTITALLVMPARTQTEVEKLYKVKCAMCHAADGSGNTPAGKKLGAHDLRSPEVQKQTDEQLIETTAKGRGKMQGFAKTLRAEQIKELIAYVRELAKKH